MGGSYYLMQSLPNLNVYAWVFLCCITNYHIFTSLKQHPFILSYFCRWEAGRFGWVLYLGSLLWLTRLKSGCQRPDGFLSGGSGRISLQTHSGCWPGLVPCGRRTEVPVSLLAVSRALLSVLRALSIPSPMTPSPCCSATWCIDFSHLKSF